MKKLHILILVLLLVMNARNSFTKNPYLPGDFVFTSRQYYSVYIMDQGRSSVEDLAGMLLFYNPELRESFAKEIALIYFEESMDEGVNHDIAFCQMILETGFLNFGGSVMRQQNNFCGLGATGGMVRGEKFPDIRTGVRAHIQHLKAYASFDDIYKESVDKRFRFVKRGTAQTIYALPGKWAADPNYDQKLEGLLQRLFALKSLIASQQNTNIPVY